MPFHVHSCNFIARLVALPRCQRACWVGCRSPCSFRSIGRDGFLDHKVDLGYEASTFVQRRGRFEETSRVHIGPERVCGANRLSLSVPMHVWSSDESTTRHHAKSSARGAMRRTLGHEDRLLRSALTSHRRLQRRLSWFSCPSGPAFNWSGLHSH